MSELGSNGSDRIASEGSGAASPFGAVKVRHRMRGLVTTGIIGAAVIGVLAGAVAVSAHRSSQPGGLARPNAGPSPSAAPSLSPSPADQSPPPSGRPGAQQPSAVDRAAYELWKLKGAKDYTMTVVRTCFCTNRGEPVTVTVRGGKVTPPQQDGNGALKSIDDLFDLILGGKADEFTARYDPTFGHPTSVRFDFIRDAVDDEIDFAISNYRAS